jgi:hypothetical protein
LQQKEKRKKRKIMENVRELKALGNLKKKNKKLQGCT